MPSFIVEELTHEFDQELVMFFLRGVRESSLHKAGINLTPESISRDVAIYIDDPNKAIFVVKNEDGWIIGVLMTGVGNYSFSDTKVATEYFFRVDEEYRRHRVGNLLKEAGLKWAKDKGAKLLIVGVGRFVGRDYQESDEAYLKMGFKDFHRNYYLEI